MNKIETGGPAFPGKAYSGLPNEGLSLRDYFAAKAMQGTLASMQNDEVFPFKEGPAWAYKMADAMLEARK